MKSDPFLWYRRGSPAMRLTKSQIQFLGYRITDDLQVSGYIDPEEPNALMDTIIDLITEDLRKEDELNEEVRQILDGYGEEIRSGGIEYREMFKLVKKRLARERGMIL